jgi:hypothetical protein
VLDNEIQPSPGRANDLASTSTPVQAQRLVNVLFTQPALSRAAHSYEQSAAIDEQHCPGREGLVGEERVAGRDLVWVADRPREIRLGGVFVVGLRSASGMPDHNGLRTVPGDTAFTRTGASSTARALAYASIVPAVPDATAHPGDGRAPAIPLVSTIDPPGRIRAAACFATTRIPKHRTS